MRRAKAPPRGPGLGRVLVPYNQDAARGEPTKEAKQQQCAHSASALLSCKSRVCLLGDTREMCSQCGWRGYSSLLNLLILKPTLRAEGWVRVCSANGTCENQGA
jgi:hypothetical protein